MLRNSEVSILSIADLWESKSARAWELALESYWQWVSPANLKLEQQLDKLKLSRIKRMDPQQWYDFLHDEYFRWKYTAPNRYATTSRTLEAYLTTGTLNELHDIKQRLLRLDLEDIRGALAIAKEIKGLGVSGASGLLALMYPAAFGTVDQFVVKALQRVKTLDESTAVAKMNPDRSISTTEGVVLIEIMRRKAADNNRRFKTDQWTPRKIDMILWATGR